MSMKKALIWLLLFTFLLPTWVSAQENANTCHPGDVFEAVFALTNDSAIPDAVVGEIEFDHDVFEPIPSNSVVNRDGRFALFIYGGILVPVSFRVSKYAPADTYTISVKVLDSTEKNNQVKIAPVQVRIGPAPTQPPTSNPETTPTVKLQPSPARTPELSEPPEPTAIPDKPNTYYHDKSKGDWLPGYQNSDITGNWAVYSGPGENYYRADNDKATTDCGTCRVFGIENKWVMIEYELTNGRSRIGFVKQEALPQVGLNIPYLDLKYTTRQLKSEAKLTDDIAHTHTTLATLPKGMFVLFLGYVSETNITWAYVEVNVGGSLIRGFINSSALL